MTEKKRKRGKGGVGACTRCLVETVEARLDMAADSLVDCKDVVKMWQAAETHIRLEEARLWWSRVQEAAREQAEHTCR